MRQFLYEIAVGPNDVPPEFFASLHQSDWTDVQVVVPENTGMEIAVHPMENPTVETVPQTMDSSQKEMSEFIGKWTRP